MTNTNDLVIRGGTVATAKTSDVVDVAIDGGKITQLGAVEAR